MNNLLTLWKIWQTRVKEILPQVHDYTGKALGWYVLGILLGKSVVPHQVAPVYRRFNAVKLLSHVRRLERFLSNPAISQPIHWYPFLSIFLQEWKGKTVQLILDASPLMGEHQMYMVGLVFDHRILPLVWKVVPLHSAWEIDQWTMVREMVAVLKPYFQDGSCTLLADRGLGCEELVHICQEAGWHYLFRITSCGYYQTDSGDWQGLAQSGLQQGQCRSMQTCVWTTHPLLTYLTLAWEPGYKEPWYLISDLFSGKRAVHEYAKRMRIESSFQDWKKRGWRLTASLVKDPARLDRLLIVLAIAWWWIQREACACIHHGYRSLFDRTERRDLSYLKIGLLWIQELLRRSSPPASLARIVPFFHRQGRLVFTLRP